MSGYRGWIQLQDPCCCCGLVVQSCLTLCSVMDCNPQGISVHGLSKARILEWMPFPSPGDLSNPGIKLHLLLGRWILYHWATWEAPQAPYLHAKIVYNPLLCSLFYVTCSYSSSFHSEHLSTAGKSGTLYWGHRTISPALAKLHGNYCHEPSSLSWAIIFLTSQLPSLY